jgi:hypothetical protein
VVALGALPVELVSKAHKEGARVSRGVVFSQDMLANASARASWVTATCADLKASGGDGLTLMAERYISQGPPSAHERDGFSALAAALSSALPASATLSMTVNPFSPRLAERFDFPALVKASVGRVIVAAYDACLGAQSASANTPTAAIGSAVSTLSAAGVGTHSLVVALPWHGWDFPCAASDGTAVTEPSLSPQLLPACTVTPPADYPGVDVTWDGWCTRSAYSFLVDAQRQRANATAVVSDPAVGSDSLTYDYTDGAERRHRVVFDGPGTLRRKYAAALALGVAGVGVWTADMVNPGPQAVAMWAALPTASDVTTDVYVTADVTVDAAPFGRIPLDRGATSGGATPSSAGASPSRDEVEEGGAESSPALAHARGRRLMRRRDTPPSPVLGDRGQCQANVCAGPKGQHGSGQDLAFPATGAVAYSSLSVVPPLPAAFAPSQSTIYYYFNLIPPNLEGVGHFNQFVPQLMLGETMCGSSGSSTDPGYQAAACAVTDPVTHWVVQAQYFYALEVYDRYCERQAHHPLRAS